MLFEQLAERSTSNNGLRIDAKKELRTEELRGTTNHDDAIESFFFP